MIYQRICRKVCVGMLLLALTVKMVLATGADQTAGSIVSNLAANESFISWMLYLEVGQVYSAREASDLAQEAVLAAQQTPQAPSQEQAPSVPDQTVDRDDPPPQADPPEIQTEDPPSKPEPQQSGDKPDGAAASAQEPGPEQDPPSQGQTDPSGVQASAPLRFTEEEAQGISIAGACSYEVDKLELLNKTLDLEFTGQEPTVLIVHTHSSEAYTQETGWEYEESDRLRTQDTGHSVIKVGEEIAEVLRSHGISVIHDTSINDYPSYNGAYTRTLEHINEWLRQYPSIQMVLDVHRDAQEDADGTPLGSVVTVGDEPSSQVMLVVGTDEGGLEHPNWSENLALALQVQAVANREYPSLMRNLNLRTERFNQHATKGSLLLEMGSTGNTLKQALVAARAIAESLAQVIACYS